MNLNLVFMGTPAFAAPALGALLDAGHNVAGVFTQPDRRAGRGRRLTPPPVKTFAEERGIPVFQPASLRDNATAAALLARLAPDAIIVAAYGLFLPTVILELPRLGCLNIHPSLLPKYRGPSPVVSAMLEGETRTGVTVMLLDEGMDSGPILAQVERPIGGAETADALTDHLFEIGAALLTQTLDEWAAGELSPTPQNDADATFTRRLTREDGRLDWSEPADALDRRVRAMTPWPGAFTTWRGRTVKILSARVADRRDELPEDAASAPPGTVIRWGENSIGVVAGNGALKLFDLQMEGRRRARVWDFIAGYQDFVGATLGD